MAKYHINDNNEPKKCKAKKPSKCKFYKGKDDARHYSDKQEAITAAEETSAKEAGGNFDNKAKKKTPSSVDKITEEQIAEQQKVKMEIAGYNDNFLTTKLRNDTISPYAELDSIVRGVQDFQKLPEGFDQFDEKELRTKLFNATSTISDKGISFKAIEEMGVDLGGNVNRIHNSDLSSLAKDNSEVGWVISFKGKKGKPNSHIIVTDKPHSRITQTDSPQDFENTGDGEIKAGDTITRADVRTLVANRRIERASGVNLLKSLSTNRGKDSNVAKLDTLKVLSGLEKQQQKARKVLNYPEENPDKPRFAGSSVEKLLV